MSRLGTLPLDPLYESAVFTIFYIIDGIESGCPGTTLQRAATGTCGHKRHPFYLFSKSVQDNEGSGRLP